MADGGLFRGFISQALGEPAALLVIQPLGLLGAVGKHEQAGDAQQYGRNAFENEQPVPATHAHPAIQVQQQARQWRTNEVGGRDRHHEQRHHARAVGRRQPVGEVQQHAREETGLGSTQQKAHHVQ